MEQGLFAHLPSEIIINILLRLPVRAVALSKCVCKPWLDLLESDDFVNSHHSKSAAALAVSLPETGDSYPCKVFELEDELESHNPITKFDFPRKARFGGSADDLIFLRNSEVNFVALYVCNPITREFIELHFRDELLHSNRFRRVAYGFGASKGTRQHKVVRFDSKSNYCHVYTLGTGRWRRVEAATATASASSLYESAFLNGILYWKVSDSKYEAWISCFDLETERFSTVSHPPVRGSSLHFDLVSLRDCLCAVDDTTDYEIVLWLLEECGAEKSWTMSYKIDPNPDYDVFGGFEPIKVFKNGDILILFDSETFLCYSIKAKTYQEIPSFGAHGRRCLRSLHLTPSFRSLERSFAGMENVISF